MNDEIVNLKSLKNNTGLKFHQDRLFTFSALNKRMDGSSYKFSSMHNNQSVAVEQSEL